MSDTSPTRADADALLEVIARLEVTPPSRWRARDQEILPVIDFVEGPDGDIDDKAFIGFVRQMVELGRIPGVPDPAPRTEAELRIALSDTYAHWSRLARLIREASAAHIESVPLYRSERDTTIRPHQGAVAFTNCTSCHEIWPCEMARLAQAAHV